MAGGVVRIALTRDELTAFIRIMEGGAQISGNKDLLGYLRKQSEAVKTADALLDGTKDEVPSFPTTAPLHMIPR